MVLVGRVTRLDVLPGTSLRNCLKMTKSSWWDTAELALSSLQHSLLGLDATPAEPVEIAWETKGLAEETVITAVTTEGFATDGEVVTITS